jgi:hypothetical protein
MKKKEFEKLLGLVDQKGQGLPDFSGFSNPDDAKMKFVEILHFRNTPSENEKDFSPFFTESVMGRIKQYPLTHGLEEYLSMQFNRVMAFGLTAVVLTFLTLYFLQGQDGVGTLFGADRTNDINFISYLFYEF